jgi:hypothetical protein
MSAKLLTFPERPNTITQHKTGRSLRRKARSGEELIAVWHRLIANPKIEELFERLIAGCVKVNQPVEDHVIEMLDVYQDVTMDTLLEFVSAKR